MSWGNVSTKNDLNKLVDDTAFKYVKELKMPWFDKYQGYSHVRFNKYAENKKNGITLQTIFIQCLMVKEKAYQY